MYFIKINGTEAPTPFYYSVETNDIDSADSYRSDETGIMHRRKIRESVKTCEVKWRLDGDKTEGLQEDLSDDEIMVTLLDPATCGYTTAVMYAENLKSVFYQQQEGSESKSYWELSCRLIEY